jgi:hypothetical protein
LGEAFVEALASDFDQHGEVIIKTVRAKSPEVYLKIIKDVLPREVLLRSFTVTASLDLAEVEATKGRLAAYKYARDMIGAPLQDEPVDIEEGAIGTGDVPAR